MSEQKIAVLGEKIRKARRKSIIAFSVMVIFLMVSVVSFSMLALVLVGASLSWAGILMVEIATIALGCLGIVMAAVFWKRMRSADEEKDKHNRQLHEEVLIPAGFEYCPFCKKSLKA